MKARIIKYKDTETRWLTRCEYFSCSVGSTQCMNCSHNLLTDPYKRKILCSADFDKKDKK